MATLYFPGKHKTLVDELCNTPVIEGGNPVFPRLRELMLFAAMVGKYKGKFETREGNGGEVESHYFSGPNFHKEGVIYLLGILEFQDPETLKDGAKDCWKLFESYSAGGMEIISGWLEETEDVVGYTEVLEEKILEIARAGKKVPVKVKRPKTLDV